MFDGDLAHGLTGSQAAGNGYGTGYGFHVKNSEFVTLENSEIFNFKMASVLQGNDNLIIKDNDIHSIRSDGLHISGANDMLIEGNHIHDFNRAPGSSDHSDMIQFTTGNHTSPTTDITIRGNFLNSGSGDLTQSLFMRNGAVDSQGGGSAMYYRNIVIEDNVIHNSHTHGITLGEAVDSIVRNNTLLQNRHALTDTQAGQGLFNPAITSTMSRARSLPAAMSSARPTAMPSLWFSATTPMRRTIWATSMSMPWPTVG